MKLMTEKQKIAWAARMKGYLQGYIFVEFVKKGAKIPNLVFDTGSADCYTDGSNEIHLGLDMFEAENENDMFWQVFFVLGHELQHVHSTRNRDWKFGINQQVRNACSALSVKVFGAPVKLVRQSDFEAFSEKLCQKGYYISIRKLQTFAHFVCNSLEDGRIENIRSQKYKTFPRYMKKFRGERWLEDKSLDSAPEYPKLDALGRLQIKLNQILSLATVQKFQQGFLKKYAGTPLESDVRAFIPHIKTAVSSRNCRGCMEEAVKIGKMLGDDLIEASRNDEFENFIEQLVNMIMSEMKRNENDDLSSSEETGDGSSKSQFGKSELDEENEEGKDSSASDDEGNDENAEGNEGSGSSDDESEEDGSDEENISSGSSEDDSDEEDMKNAASESEDVKTPEQAEAEKEINRQKKAEREGNLLGIPSKPKGIPDPVEGYENVGFVEKLREYPVDQALPSQYNNMAQSFRREIRKILQKKKSMTMRGMRSGSVDGSQLTKLVFADTKIFRRQKEEKPLDAVIYILQDNSGSMGDSATSSRAYCSAAAAIVEEGFRGVCPVKIVAFSEYGEVIHRIVKDFDESSSSSSFSWSFFEHDRCGGGNFDAYSIKVATREILERPEKQKILIVASDGLPCCPVSDVKKAVDEARSHGIVTVGLFLDGEAPEEFTDMYGSGSLATTPEQVCSELPRVIKNAVFR